MWREKKGGVGNPSDRTYCMNEICRITYLRDHGTSNSDWALAERSKAYLRDSILTQRLAFKRVVSRSYDWVVVLYQVRNLQLHKLVQVVDA